MKNFSNFKGTKLNRGDQKDGSFKIQNSGSKKVKEDGYRKYQKDEDKEENKLLGDYGYDYNYCHEKNHFTKECMLRKLNEKKEKSKYEA